MSIIIMLSVLLLIINSSSSFTNSLQQQQYLTNNKSSNNNSDNIIKVNRFYGQKFFVKLIARLFEMLNLKQVVNDIRTGKSSEGTCYSCKFGMALTQHLLEFGKERDEMAKLALTICNTLNIDTNRVCKGVVHNFKNEFITVLSKLTLSPNEICGIILGNSCGNIENPLHNWTLPLTPYPKPYYTSSSLEGQYHYLSEKPSHYILHISDTHVDLQYREGSNALCGEPLCCRTINKYIPAHQKAGYWGDYRDCDIPMRTLESMLRDIRDKHHHIDYIIWTGDIPPHDIWNQTRDEHLRLIRKISYLINKYLGNIPIYPSLGNHESAPVNSFAPPSVKGSYSSSWLYDVIGEIWSKWLPESTLKTIKKGGYYSTMVKSDLKLISMNMNYCNNQNWWLLLNSTDPADELTWLINELQSSELLRHKVHIIGHIPPGSNDCYQVWSQNYNRIVNRFENTIVGQFFGHTHMDEFELFYADDNNNYYEIETIISEKEKEKYKDNNIKRNNINTKKNILRPTNIAYIGPSSTTFNGVNPGYRIYHLSSNKSLIPYSVINHETWFLNLTQANMQRKTSPKWVLSYNAKDAYNLKSLSPLDWHLFVMEMISNPSLFNKFYTHYFNKSDLNTSKQCTTSECKEEIICKLISSKSQDNSLCENFIKKLST